MKEKKTTSINLRGIERAVSDINVPDGAGDEIINLRLKDGSWRPLGGKVPVNTFIPIAGYENFTNIYKHIILGDNLYIAKNGNNIILIDSSEDISPTSYNAGASVINTEFDIQINILGSYTIESDVAWLTPSELNGSGLGSITITIGPSITSDRSGKITVTGDNGVYECDVDQLGIILTADTPVEATKLAQDVVIDITSILPVGSTFSSAESPDVAWITNLVDDQGSDTVTATLTENISGSQRTATIRITHVEFPTIYTDIVITQSEKELSVLSDTSDWTGLEIGITHVIPFTADPDTTIYAHKSGDTSRFTVVVDNVLDQVEITTVFENYGPDWVCLVELTDNATPGVSSYPPASILCTQTD